MTGVQTGVRAEPNTDTATPRWFSMAKPGGHAGQANLVVVVAAETLPWWTAQQLLIGGASDGSKG